MSRQSDVPFTFTLSPFEASWSRSRDAAASCALLRCASRATHGIALRLDRMLVVQAAVQDGIGKRRRRQVLVGIRNVIRYDNVLGLDNYLLHWQLNASVHAK